MTMVPS